MPIIDIECVCKSDADFAKISAQKCADNIGVVLRTPPGRTWVKLRYLNSAAYAENQVALGENELPAFVTVLHAHPPEGAARATEVLALTSAVAKCLGRAADCVHVQYALAGAGRQAFGGRLVE